MWMIEAIAAYLGWTLLLYLWHRLAHTGWWPWLKKVHNYHHASYHNGWYQDAPPLVMRWLGFQTTDKREITEQVVLEVLPTLAFCAITGHWWIYLFFHLDNAVASPELDHNPRTKKWTWIGHGRYHVLHHEEPSVNYSIYLNAWDQIFGSYRRP